MGHYGLGGFDVKQNAFLGHEWPPEAELQLQGFRDAALRFQRRTHAVALLLLRALAIALGHPEDFFEEVRARRSSSGSTAACRPTCHPHA